MANTWGKERRILKRTDFTICYNSGVKLQSRFFIAFVCRKADQPLSRVGFAVTKKVGNAVMRNRMKRLLREFCRKNQEILPKSTDIVFTPKKHIKIALYTYDSLYEELCGLLKKYE